MTAPHERNGALEAVDRILNRGGEADAVLREVVAVLARLYPYVAFAFVEDGGLVVGPEAGGAQVSADTWPVLFDGAKVAELRVAGAGDDDRAFLERVAVLVSPYCLVGWDTGGEEWRP